MRKAIVLGWPLLLFAVTARAAIHTEPVSYKDGNTILKGYLAYDDASASKRPGVLVVHEWWGLTDYPKEVAKRLAQLGYAALAVDMYGEGRTTDKPEEAAVLSGELKKSPALARSRFEAALAALKAQPVCDSGQIAAIGFCFGGTMVLEMARLGEPLRGVVSFHGGLSSAIPEADRHIKAKILVCHGGDDSFVPRAEVEAFQDEMRKAGADWQMIVYGGAVHSFTNPAANGYHLDGAKYNAAAARRSWEHMKLFLHELFAQESEK